jgi:predicted transcriptional regulator
MSTENKNHEMNVESFQMKIENQQNIIRQLSNENEQLYHQFNHLMIRNNKLLKRINDLQEVIDDLHIRIEELQLINGNTLKLHDRSRQTNDRSSAGDDFLLSSAENTVKINDELAAKEEVDHVFSHWKNYPGQDAKNEPNLRKQAQMLVQLFRHKALRATDLFAKTGVGGVTGARYVATLKKSGLISYTGARKKGQYEMTQKGFDFIAGSIREPFFSKPVSAEKNALLQTEISAMEQQGIPVRDEVKETLSSHWKHADL